LISLADLGELIETDRSAAGNALDQALREKHGTGDAAGMLALHRLAIEFWQGDPQQVSFHLTHAYVYALEAGDWKAVDALYADLAVQGRI